MTIRIKLSLALLSASIITFQLALMQVLSLTQWYHFAYMVISVALLGFGGAGTLLSLFRKTLIKNAPEILPSLMILTAIAMASSLYLTQTEWSRFDSYLVFLEWAHVGKLFSTFIIFIVPFLIGALAIGIIFIIRVEEIGNIYGANLIGSALGGIIFLFLINSWSPEKLTAMSAWLAFGASLVLMKRQSSRFTLVLLSVGALIICLILVHPPRLIPSQFKGLSKALTLPDSEIIAQEPSPYGLIQVVQSEHFRFAPGLSLTYLETIPVRQTLFLNGNWLGPIVPLADSDSGSILDYSTFGLPFKIRSPKKVLILQAGSSFLAHQVLSHEGSSVHLVEVNSKIRKLLEGELVEQSDSLLFHPGISYFTTDSRSFIKASSETFDLILLPTVNGLGGSSGIEALHENYLLTQEALGEMWQKLTPSGVIAIQAWMDYPYRYPLRVYSSLLDLLESKGVKDPKYHIGAIRSWGTIGFVLSKKPLELTDLGNIRKFCLEMGFDPAILPDIDPSEQAKFNQLQDDSFFRYLEFLNSSGKDDFLARYPFDLRPVRDDRPFFSQFLKWNKIGELQSIYQSFSIPFLEAGYVIVILTFILISLLALILILVPLAIRGKKWSHKSWIFFYFSGIGVGYMFIEIVVIQRFTLYLGSPIYSAGVAISALLLFSGMGSLWTQKQSISQPWLKKVLGGIVLIIISYGLGLDSLLQWTIHFPMLGKVVLSAAALSPLAFLMGVPFPAALFFLGRQNDFEIPWAWGINSCLSVISAVLALILAVELGFTWVFILGSLAYGISWLVMGKSPVVPG